MTADPLHLSLNSKQIKNNSRCTNEAMLMAGVHDMRALCGENKVFPMTRKSTTTWDYISATTVQPITARYRGTSKYPRIAGNTKKYLSHVA
jgi:hypothetical protein